MYSEILRGTELMSDYNLQKLKLQEFASNSQTRKSREQDRSQLVSSMTELGVYGLCWGQSAAALGPFLS